VTQPYASDTHGHDPTIDAILAEEEARHESMMQRTFEVAAEVAKLPAQVQEAWKNCADCTLYLFTLPQPINAFAVTTTYSFGGLFSGGPLGGASNDPNPNDTDSSLTESSANEQERPRSATLAWRLGAFWDGVVPFVNPFENLYAQTCRECWVSADIGAWTRDVELFLLTSGGTAEASAVSRFGLESYVEGSCVISFAHEADPLYVFGRGQRLRTLLKDRESRVMDT
jgi:hypothetical protein